MTIQGILSFTDIEPTVRDHYPDAENRVKGTPLRTTKSYFANEAHGVTSGIWNAEVGAYKIYLVETKHEFFHIISGRVQIEDAQTGKVTQFGPGEVGIIPPGFRGIFEILEAASKFWVVTERAV
jgi:uncharacterized cupin superfamily protein